MFSIFLGSQLGLCENRQINKRKTDINLLPLYFVHTWEKLGMRDSKGVVRAWVYIRTWAKTKEKRSLGFGANYGKIIKKSR